MDPIQGALLGAVQGLTEPLPVSSSAHLILLPWLLGWQEHSLTFDVALHMGTLAALLLVFWKDWLDLARAWLPGGAAVDRRMGLGLVAGTLPAAVIGLLFEDVIESSLRSPSLIAVVMVIASLLIFAADRLGRRRLSEEALSVPRALVIGAAQALALMPGVSRSGATISAGLALGLTREAAARYAFLLATPVTAGAGVFKLRDLLETGVPPDERAAFIAGITTSFVVGLFAIRFLLQYLRRYSLIAFVVYRVALALLVLALSFIRAA
ncbi:MAG TPA: undecaprenyl-diphosphatase UppP [Chloroflexota bacterium]|nr:undecaprenyl-diphosphatase UppP [Chloroflexota bacterium]